MATVYISEFCDMLGLGKGLGSLAKQPSIAEQTVAIGGGSVQSAAFNNGTTFIRVHTDAICSILIGENPTAVATKCRMAAGQTEYFAVRAGHKIAVITNS